MLRVGRGFGKLAWKGGKSEVCIIRGLLGGPKSQRFGIGLAAAFAPEVKGVDGRLLLPSLSLMLQLDLVEVVVAL